ncbi:MAG: hypothetical protein H6706_06960 [Myxococcales bacterium]|nr:hypothetical protein [Myxococcales bacterium]
MAFILKIVVTWAVVSALFGGIALAVPAIHVGARLRFLLAVATFGLANVALVWLLTFVLKAVLFLPVILSLGLVGLLIPIVVNAALLKAIDVKFGEAVRFDSVRALLGTATAVSVGSFVVGLFF